MAYNLIGKRILMISGELNGRIGTVVDIAGGRPPIGVEFDEEDNRLHDCNGNAKMGHGYYVDEEEFEIINDVEVPKQVGWELINGVPTQVTKPSAREENYEMADNERQWLPEDFMFSGQSVILNPESHDYQFYKNEKDIGDNSGYVVSHEASEGDMPIILSKGARHMPNWNVRVLWDNGKTTTLRVRDLLQLNEPIKEVKSYRISNGLRINVFDERGQEELDRQIIVKGQEIDNVTTFNEEYRKKHIARAYEIMSRR